MSVKKKVLDNNILDPNIPDLKNLEKVKCSLCKGKGYFEYSTEAHQEPESCAQCNGFGHVWRRFPAPSTIQR